MKDTSLNQVSKQLAAEKAVSFVQDGMIVGLGTGSTAAFAIKKIGQLVNENNFDIRCVATSFQSALLAKENGLHLLALDSISSIDISIDGADRIDKNRNLIKGGGAAHTREKIVHAMSDRFIVVADSSKIVDNLNDTFPVPIEFLPVSMEFVKKRLKSIGADSIDIRMAKRKDGPVITDNGMMIFDAIFHQFDPDALETKINLIPGVLENGIFSSVKPASGDCLIGSGSQIEYL